MIDEICAKCRYLHTSFCGGLCYEDHKPDGPKIYRITNPVNMIEEEYNVRDTNISNR